MLMAIVSSSMAKYWSLAFYVIVGQSRVVVVCQIHAFGHAIVLAMNGQAICQLIVQQNRDFLVKNSFRPKTDEIPAVSLARIQQTYLSLKNCSLAS